MDMVSIFHFFLHCLSAYLLGLLKIIDRTHVLVPDLYCCHHYLLYILCILCLTIYFLAIDPLFVCVPSYCYVMCQHHVHSRVCIVFLTCMFYFSSPLRSALLCSGCCYRHLLTMNTLLLSIFQFQ